MAHSTAVKAHMEGWGFQPQATGQKPFILWGRVGLHSAQAPAGSLPRVSLRIEAIREGGPRTLRAPDGAQLLVYVPRALVARVAAAMGRPATDLAPGLVPKDEIVLRLSLLLLEDTESGSQRGGVYTESLSMALVAHLFANYGLGLRPPVCASQLPRGLLLRVTNYLEAHLDEVLPVRGFAALLGLSPSHFSALFKRATGISPHQFLIQRRVERAKSLLLSSGEPISQIAVRVGFCDQSHLTKQMRRLLGVSPGRLRRMDKQFSAERT